MGSSPKTPPPPDYGGLAQQQSDIDRQALLQQTIANRPNQKNPFGEIKWTMDPETGQWTQEEIYDPRLQGLADKSLDIQGGLYDRMGGLMDRGDWQSAPGASLYDPQDLGIDSYDPASGDEFSRMFSESLLSRVRPQQQVDQRAMETRLRLQGLQPGTEAYDRAYQNLLTSQGDVNAQAQLQGMLAGGKESRDIYNTRLQSALGLSGDRRASYATRMMGQQQMNDQSLEQWLQPMNDIQSMQGLANAYNQFRPGYQGFTSAQGSAGADMMGAAQQQYQTQVQRANEAHARKQQQGSMWGSVIGGVAGAFVGQPMAGAAVGGAAGSYFSDAALKENIEQISDEDAFHALQRVHPHSFTWPNGSRGGGLIAQEVREVFPHLVSEDTGYLKVDYEGFTALLLGAFRHLAKENSNVRQ